jgi:poly-gamma-glutamate synthesis protein (capsule biosynthesis protein)
LVNLECVIAKGGEHFFPPRVFYFRADPRTAEALSVAGVDFVSLANNHAMDFQAEGLLETIDHLDRLGIAHAGAGCNRQAASKPAIVQANGIKIGVIAFADHFREYAAGEDSPGTNLIEVDLEGKNVERVRTAIQAARTAGADLVIFSIHWGPNMRQVPTPDFIDFAHAVMDTGVDIFHGHSAHIFQGIEVYDSKLILYDTGDLIDDYYVDPDLRNDQQLLYIVKATQAGIERLEMVPLLIDHMQVNLAQRENFNAIRERLARLSRRFGTEISREHNRLVIEVRGEGSK